MKSVGQQLGDVYVEIEKTLFEADIRGMKPNYDIKAFRAGTKIFLSVLMDKMWELSEAEEMSMENRTKMATKAGEDIRRLVQVYTGIDTHTLYE